MSGDQSAQLLWYALVIMFVGSSLFVRRIPLGELAKNALIWVLIFGAVFLAVRGYQTGAGL